MSFHVARKKKRTSPLAIQHGLRGLRDYLVQCAWSPSFGLCFFILFYFFTWHQWLIIVLFVVHIQYDVWQYYAQHSSIWIRVGFTFTDSSQISSHPSFCSVAVNFSSSLMFVVPSSLSHFQSTIHLCRGRVIQLFFCGRIKLIFIVDFIK